MFCHLDQRGENQTIFCRESFLPCRIRPRRTRRRSEDSLHPQDTNDGPNPLVPNITNNDDVGEDTRIRYQGVGFVHTHTWEIQSKCSSLCYTFINIKHDGITDIFQGFVHDIHATSPSTQTTAKFSKTGSKRTTSLLTDHPPCIPSKIHHKDRVPVEEFNAKIPNVQDCPISKKWRATTYKLDKNCTMTFANSLQPGTRIRQITSDGHFREFWGWCPFTTQITKMFHCWPLVERAHTCWKVWAKHLSPNITG